MDMEQVLERLDSMESDMGQLREDLVKSRVEAMTNASEIVKLRNELRESKMKIRSLENAQKSITNTKPEVSQCPCGFRRGQADDLERKVSSMQKKYQDLKDKCANFDVLQRVLNSLVMKGQGKLQTEMQIEQFQAQMDSMRQQIEDYHNELKHFQKIDSKHTEDASLIEKISEVQDVKDFQKMTSAINEIKDLQAEFECRLDQMEEVQDVKDFQKMTSAINEIKDLQAEFECRLDQMEEIPTIGVQKNQRLVQKHRVPLSVEDYKNMAVFEQVFGVEKGPARNIVLLSKFYTEDCLSKDFDRLKGEGCQPSTAMVTYHELCKHNFKFDTRCYVGWCSYNRRQWWILAINQDGLMILDARNKKVQKTWPMGTVKASSPVGDYCLEVDTTTGTMKFWTEDKSVTAQSIVDVINSYIHH